MHLRWSSAALLCLLCPAALHAQTAEIQEEIETRLWWQRLWQSFGIAGIPPLVVVLTLLAVVAAGLLWRSRRKRAD